MSYEPTVWKTGDVVTSDKLNKLENGVAGADNTPMVISITNGALSETFGAIKTAALAGQMIYIQRLDISVSGMRFTALTEVVAKQAGGIVYYNDKEYTADTDEDYPTESGIS